MSAGAEEDVRDPEPWRYYPQLRHWARGDRLVVVPRCSAVLDSSRMFAVTGVILVGDVECEREVGHEKAHMHPWPYPAQWGDQWTK